MQFDPFDIENARAFDSNMLTFKLITETDKTSLLLSFLNVNIVDK